MLVRVYVIIVRVRLDEGGIFSFIIRTTLALSLIRICCAGLIESRVGVIRVLLLLLEESESPGVFFGFTQEWLNTVEEALSSTEAAHFNTHLV